MSSAAKRKGTQGGEIPVVNWLKANGFPYAERRLAGSHLDRGDVAGVNGVTIEVKNHVRLDLSAWLKEQLLDGLREISKGEQLNVELPR